MRIFKFGGAAVENAARIRNVYEVLKQSGYEDVLIIVSAMGKTTNAFEVVVEHYCNKSALLSGSLKEIEQYHHQILLDLFDTDTHPVFDEVATLFSEIDYFMSHNKSRNYNFVYDQIVSYGEIISTTIVSHFLETMGINNQLIDVRDCVKTDSNHRDAVVDWEATERSISQNIKPEVVYITQGFLGSDENGFTTTLGREGSDYTAAIFAYCLGADSVTVWKDVPGVMNADPHYFENAILLKHISYREAIELAFYGASIIHPKTLQPLQKNEIPLYVKSFLEPKLPGTSIGNRGDLKPYIPCYIVKRNQLLLSLSSIDFDFIMEENISEIFALLHHYRIKVSLIQNSAISFSICVEDTLGHFEELKISLSKKFTLSFAEHVTLYTIRHFTDQAANSIMNKKNVLLHNISSETMQVIVKED
jgi:aspartate kinase